MKILSHNSGYVWLSELNESLFHCEVDEVLKAIQHAGYILFRNFNPTQDEFEKFTNLFGVCADTRHVHYPNTGEGLGFHAEDALRMAAQTARGAASLLLTNNSHPENEIDKVTSPKGCTIAGLNEMEHAGFSSALIKGIRVSQQKAGALYPKD